MRKFNVAVVGATGAVGEELFRVMEEVDFPVGELLPLASAKSAGTQIEFKGKNYKVVELTETVFDEHEIDIAFFSAGGSVSEKYAKFAAASGAVVIDNTSHFRMDADVPLVVQLQKFFEFKLDECEPKVFAHQLAFNVIPHIDVFLDNDYTKEEMKMVNETQKILHKNMEVSATCVRVPVLRSHSEAITIHFDRDVDAAAARELLRKAPSIVVVDEPAAKKYPMPSISSDTNETYVGRIRTDNYRKNVLHLWCSADQIRVGAATNAVRIAQKWIEMQE